MTISDFYVLRMEGRGFGDRWACADLEDPVNRAGAQRCPVCGHPLSGRAWLEPHLIRLSRAKPERWPDFLFGAGFRLMVSRRWVEVYQEEGLTGITRFHPQARILSAGRKLMSELEEPRPVYRLVDIAYSRTRVALGESGVVTEEPRQPRCPECLMDGGNLLKFDRVVFEPGSWSGEDIFFARGIAGLIFVSRRFAGVVGKHGLKGAELIAAEQYSKCWGPGLRG